MWLEFPGCSCTVVLMTWMMMTSRSFFFMMSTSSSLMTMMSRSNGWLLLLLMNRKRHWWVNRCWALWCRCLSRCGILSPAGWRWSLWLMVCLTMRMLMMSTTGRRIWWACSASWCRWRWPRRCWGGCDAIGKGDSSCNISVLASEDLDEMWDKFPNSSSLS